MVTKRVYYPLTGNAGKYKTPANSIFFMSADYDDLYATDPGGTLTVMKADEAVNYLLLLPACTWVFTYGSQEWIAKLFANHLDLITSLESLGEYQCTTIKTPLTKIYIVDLYQITSDPLRKTASKLGINLIPFDDGIEAHLTSKLQTIHQLHDQYNLALNVTWGIYQSRSTGATGLKTWRATIPKGTEYKARGKKLQALSHQAIRPGALNWEQGYYPHGCYLYDINASYINVMRALKYPLHVNTFINRDPLDRWIATVNLDYSTNIQWGVLPIRTKAGGYLRPTYIKNHTTTITYIDYQLMQLTGDVKINHFLEGMTWRPGDEAYLFTDWIERLTLANNNPIYKYVLKNVSRSLHSKFAQKSGGKSISLEKATGKEQIKEYIQQGQLLDMIILDSGESILQVEHQLPEKFIPFSFPHWEALTLSMGRLLLYTNVNEDTIYTDTDCIISLSPRNDLTISDEFGAWKKEDEGEAAIIGPRSYVIGDRVRAAGVRAVDRKRLKTAIIQASLGRVGEIEKIEHGNLIKLTQEVIKDHTIRLEKYPAVGLVEDRLYVTRSPTIEELAEEPDRLFSLPGSK